MYAQVGKPTAGLDSKHRDDSYAVTLLKRHVLLMNGARQVNSIFLVRKLQVRNSHVPLGDRLPRVTT